MVSEGDSVLRGVDFVHEVSLRANVETKLDDAQHAGGSRLCDACRPE